MCGMLSRQRLVILMVVAAVSAAAGTLWFIDRNLPDDRKVVFYHPAARRLFVPIIEIPAPVIHAFIAAEDANFFGHPGIDVPMLLRAAAVDVFRYASGGRPVGASTITQQLVKNLLLSGKVSLRRKIKEGLLALRVERALSKDRILEIYLNEIYLGCRAHGVAEAAHNYFGKTLGTLTIDDAAFLAALPKAPNHYNPLHFPKAALARRDWVLDRMVENDYLAPDQATAAKAAPIHLDGNNACGERAARVAEPRTLVGASTADHAH
jgi:penicillin-binding protein 1A